MHYMTIVQELIQQDRILVDHLIGSNSLLSTMKDQAVQLRQMHLELLSQLQEQFPNRQVEQLKAEALEVAIEQWKDQFLPSQR